MKRVLEEFVNTTNHMFDAEKIFYRLENTEAPQWRDKETLNFATFFLMKDGPSIWEIPEERQKWKMMSFISCTDDNLPAGVMLDKQAPAREVNVDPSDRTIPERW